MTMVQYEDSEDDLIPLTPLDEEEERKRREERRKDFQANEELLAAMERKPSVPLEHREDLTTADLEHFVINYCLDMFEGKRERTRQYVFQLRRFGSLGRKTVEEFVTGKQDPALEHIPDRQLKRLLHILRNDVEGY